MIELDANACQSFDDDGFVIVEQLIDNDHIGKLHRAFSDLFNGKFETGVRADEVNWQQVDGGFRLSPGRRGIAADPHPR